MFKCELGKHSTLTREGMVRVTLEVRAREYTLGGERTTTGWEIKREVKACAQHAAEHAAALAKQTT